MRLRAFSLGAVLLTVGVLAGFEARGVLDAREVVRDEQRWLTAAGLESASGLGPSTFTVTVHNGGDEAVEVLHVAPVGWRATTEPATVPPDSWVAVAFTVHVDCSAATAPGRSLVVRVETSSGEAEQVLAMPYTPAALVYERSRVCGAGPPGTGGDSASLAHP
jgi:hypothetical protein